MTKKEKNILINTILIIIIFNIVVILNYCDITKLTAIFIFGISTIVAMYIGIALLATYMLVQEKCIKLVIGCIITITLILLFDLALITLFKVQIIKTLAITLFIIDILYGIIILSKSKLKR